MSYDKGPWRDPNRSGWCGRTTPTARTSGHAGTQIPPHGPDPATKLAAVMTSSAQRGKAPRKTVQHFPGSRS